ncbi:MAG: DNA polymerase Y family protein [Chloroflexota bacterium]|nr:DNA polymerase Y family protein [Chloroflexota bacterium]
MRLLHLCWPHLPLRIERARQALPEGLVILGGQPWQPGTVLDYSPAARRLGVRRGQPLGAAHKLVPEATFLAPDPSLYRSRFEAALEALSAFTPSLEGESDPHQENFGEAFLGVEGLARLWGDETALLGRVTAAVGAIVPGPPRSGFGNTRFGARVAAIVRRSIPPGGATVEATHLAPLPIRLLPAGDELQGRFRLFGLARIGELARLDRSAVLARFGAEGGELHDLANGRDGRALMPRRPVERLRAEAELEPAVESVEPLRFVLHHLAGVLCEQLAARGSGAARASLELELEGGGTDGGRLGHLEEKLRRIRLDQELPEPVALPELLERLLLARLEVSPPPAPVSRLTLELDGTAPAAAEQLGLFNPQSAQAARLEWQLASLAIRFGAGRIYRARLRDPDAGLAEERFEWLAHDRRADPVPRARGR